MGAVIVLVIIVAILGIPPFVVGRKVEKAWKGLAALGILPVVILLVGTISWWSSKSSPDSETRDWAGLWLFLGAFAAGGMAVIGTIPFVIGRAVHHSAARARQSAELPGALSAETPLTPPLPTTRSHPAGRAQRPRSAGERLEVQW